MKLSAQPRAEVEVSTTPSITKLSSSTHRSCSASPVSRVAAATLQRQEGEEKQWSEWQEEQDGNHQMDLRRNQLVN